MRLNRPAQGAPCIGLEHYAAMLRNTAIWVVVGVLSSFIIGLLTALALNRTLRGLRLARVLIPWVMPRTVATYMWALMRDPCRGVINDLLVRVGLRERYHAWFADPRTAMPAVLVIALW